MRRVVILGGGAAGYAAAQVLAPALQARPAVTLTLISDRDHLVVRPLLSEVIAGLLPVRLARADLARLVDFGPVLVRRERVTGVETGVGRVITDAGEHPYDYLIVALGNEANAGEDWLDHPRVHVLRDLEAAGRLRTTLERARADHSDGRPDVVVVGGGPVGVDLAATLANDGRPATPGMTPACRVTLLERRDRLLPEFPSEFGEYAAELLSGLGIDVCLSAEAEAPTPAGLRSSAGDLRADAVVWAGGERPAAPVGRLADRSDGASLAIDRFLRLDGASNVFVAGANAANASFQPSPTDLGWAVRTGQLAARNVLAAMSGRSPEGVSTTPNLLAAALGPGQAVAMALGLVVRGRGAWALYRLALARALPRMANRAGLLGSWLGELAAGLT